MNPARRSGRIGKAVSDMDKKLGALTAAAAVAGAGAAVVLAKKGGGGKKLLDDFHTPGSYYENNCVPLIGSIQPNGHTSEELKGLYETRKIMELPDIKVYCHTVRVAVENSHSLGVTLKAKENFDLEQI